MNRSYRKPARGFALLLTAALIMSACGGDDDADETTTGGGGAQTAQTHTIGFVGALTGDNANLGINIRDGMKVAIEEENRADGPDIALKEFDTAGDPARRLEIAKRAQTLFHDHQLTVWMWHRESVHAIQPRLKDYRLTHAGRIVELDRAYIEE